MRTRLALCSAAASGALALGCVLTAPAAFADANHLFSGATGLRHGAEHLSGEDTARSGGGQHS